MTSPGISFSPVSPQDRDALAAAVTGPVLVPGDAAYAGEAAAFNLAVTHRPAVIVGAKNAADVQAAVRFAGTHGRPVAVLTTGHGPSVPAAEDTVLITTARMTEVVIDPTARTARVGAGVRWQQVVTEAAAHGLAPLVGSSPTVGVVGYTLGGGLSVTMGRNFGWAADHVREIEVVTADGELRRASADTATDLFWALRGGKSNFGVVTALEFALFPVTRLYAGGLYFAGEHAGEALHAFREFAAEVPDELTTSIAFLRMPDLPAVPEFLRGKLTVHVRVSFLGTETEGARLIAPLRAAAPVLMDTVAVRPYTEFGLISPGPTEPGTSVDRMATFDELTPETADAILDVVGPQADSRITIVDLRLLGGALARRSGPPSAVGRRDAAFVVFTITVVPPGQAGAYQDAGLELMDRLRPWRGGAERHPNFLTPADATAEKVRTAYDAPTYERLQEVKAAYDPGNMFRFNHNIPPRT